MTVYERLSVLGRKTLAEMTVDELLEYERIITEIEGRLAPAMVKA
jgi:hypothetical protein